MTRDEFNQWLDDFRDRFPSIAVWIDKLPRELVKDDDGFEREVTKALRTWFDIVFSAVTKDEALEVTLQLQAGEVELGGWQDLPSTYRRAVSANRQARAEYDRREPVPCDFGQYRLKCPTCRDSGLVTCWSLDAMHRARRRLHDDSVRQAWTECGVACTCEAGDKFATVTKRRGKETITEDRVRYSDDKWVRITHQSDEADRQALLSWAESYQALPKYDFGGY